MWYDINCFIFVLQKPRSRHDELKERARILLERARREATSSKMSDHKDNVEKKQSPGEKSLSEVSQLWSQSVSYGVSQSVIHSVLVLENK